MTDDLTILASAYLDGHATAAERAQVEADSELLVEVERLRRVRAVLSSSDDDATTAPLSTRERHLAAALDAWDRVPASDAGADATPAGSDQAGAAGGASITAPIPLREQRAKKRPINTRILTAAAAVVVIAGAGLIVRGALDTADDDQSADTASFELDAAADDDLSSDVLAAEEFATEGEGEAADEVVDAAAPAPAVDPEAVTAGGPDQAPPGDEVAVLNSNDDLVEFVTPFIIARDGRADTTSAESASTEAAEDAGDAPAADAEASDTDQATEPTVPPTLAPPVDRCDLIDDFVGFAFWEASGLFDDPIAVGIDNSTGEAVAYDAETCTEVSRTRLP